MSFPDPFSPRSMLSHTPPARTPGTSLDHKRHRDLGIFGGSPSLPPAAGVTTSSTVRRLRAASTVCNDGVVPLRHKGTLKDMIIAGDPKLIEALQSYDSGDPQPIRDLVRGQAFNRRTSLDLLGELGDLHFDMLSMGGIGSPGGRFEENEEDDDDDDDNDDVLDDLPPPSQFSVFRLYDDFALAPTLVTGPERLGVSPASPTLRSLASLSLLHDTAGSSSASKQAERVATDKVTGGAGAKARASQDQGQDQDQGQEKRAEYSGRGCGTVCTRKQ